jgi:transposase InsO family protein
MKEEGLTVLHKRMRKYNSYNSSEDTSYAPNILEREFTTDKPFEKLVTDITEFRVNDFKVYLSPVLDLFDGKILSWSISKNPNTDLVMDMIDDLAPQLPSYQYIILHSDRGCQYHSLKYTKALEELGIVQSMSKKGCSPDNSVMEGFFGHLKNEFFYNRNFSNHSYKQFVKALDKWINWYNNKRIKKVLGGLSPNQYRALQGVDNVLFSRNQEKVV